MIDGQGILQFTFQPADALMPFQFDVLLATTPFQQEALARAVPRRLPNSDGHVAVVRPDDLVVIKLLAGRIIDRAMILRENRSDIDFERLQRVILAQGLMDDIAQSGQTPTQANLAQSPDGTSAVSWQASLDGRDFAAGAGAEGGVDGEVDLLAYRMHLAVAEEEQGQAAVRGRHVAVVT